MESIYDYSSLDPDESNGREIGPFDRIEEVLENINRISKLDSNKYLIAGYLDNEIKTEPNKT